MSGCWEKETGATCIYVVNFSNEKYLLLDGPNLKTIIKNRIKFTSRHFFLQKLVVVKNSNWFVKPLLFER